jgi:hypothetical protein
MASLAAVDKNTENIDDDSDEAFETEMLTIHAEETFIDNLKSLKDKNISDPNVFKNYYYTLLKWGYNQIIKKGHAKIEINKFNEIIDQLAEKYGAK